jgi:hypothetical protein
MTVLAVFVPETEFGNMPAGYQVWDANGVLIFDTNSQTAKFFGTYVIGAGGDDRASGVITDARFTAFAGHQPFFVCLEGNFGSAIRDRAIWTFSGNNLSWSYLNPSYRIRQKILYGVMGIL